MNCEYCGEQLYYDGRDWCHVVEPCAKKPPRIVKVEVKMPNGEWQDVTEAVRMIDHKSDCNILMTGQCDCRPQDACRTCGEPIKQSPVTGGWFHAMDGRP